MSLKTAFASVLRAMRASRGMTQRKLAEASSRTYLSKLERGQSSPTLDMVTALSGTLNLSPLTLIALTLSAESRQPINALLGRLDKEVAELRQAGVLGELQVPFGASKTPTARSSSRPDKVTGKPSGQTELCFAD